MVKINIDPINETYSDIYELTDDTLTEEISKMKAISQKMNDALADQQIFVAGSKEHLLALTRKITQTRLQENEIDI